MSTIDPITVRVLRRELGLAESAAGCDSNLGAPAASPVQMTLLVAGLRKMVSIEPTELLHGYLLLMRVIGETHRSAGRRVAVGLAGVPGSGKSTMAAILGELWREVVPGTKLMVIGMDGWHLTNDELDRRTYMAQDGPSLPLRRRKGSPPSYDAMSLARTLRRIRQAAEDVPIPEYDRTLHEPVPDARVVPVDADIVLIEGNYLLLTDGPWADVFGQLDLPLWLDIDPAACRDGIVARHVAGGMSPDQAACKYAENDWPNARTALTGRDRAAWIIECSPSHGLIDVRPGGAAKE